MFDEDAFTTESNAICESNSAVVKRLFESCYTCIYGKYYVAYGILIDTFIVPKRLMDVGITSMKQQQFGYLQGWPSLIGLPIILTTSLAASLVPGCI